MSIKEVLRMGDARLLRRAEEVRNFNAPELHALLADMRDTMEALDGVGLAAPQIGVNQRVVIFGVRLRHVTDKTTSHSTRTSKNDDQVAGYAQQPLAGAAACNPLPHQTLTRTVSGEQPLQQATSTSSGQAQDRPHPRYPDAEAVPQTVLLNPVITPLSNDMEEDWEGCLSVPGMRGLVPRFKTIRYQGCDEYGALIDRTVSGFHARVVQHECDHLYGILYPMRMRDLRQFGFSDVLFPEGNVPEE